VRFSVYFVQINPDPEVSKTNLDALGVETMSLFQKAQRKLASCIKLLDV